MSLPFLTSRRKAGLRPTSSSSGLTDLHCRILPGFNDGPETLEQSVALIRQLHKTGFRRLIATPHVMRGFYAPSPDQVRVVTVQVRQAIQAEGIEISIVPAAEYYVDEGLLTTLRSRGDLLLFSPSRSTPESLLLVETSLITIPDAWIELIELLTNRGLVPVLAHAERYVYLQRNRDLAFFLRRQGVKFQIDLPSLMGRNGTNPQHLAEWFIEQDLVSYIGSNAQSENHLRDVKQALTLPHGRLATRG